MKEILLVHKYFYPDTPPYAYILNEMANYLSDNGCSVTVIATQPSYKSSYDNLSQPKCVYKNNIKIIRVGYSNGFNTKWLGIINSYKLLCEVIIQICKNNYKVIMISTNPQIIGSFIASYLARVTKSKFIYNIMDVHPEIASTMGFINYIFLKKILLSMDIRTCYYSNKIVVCSNDMKKSILKRGANKCGDIQVINNFALESSILETNAKQLVDSNKFNIIFAGNIGRFQKLNNIVDIAQLLQVETNIKCIFLGEGKQLNKIKELVASKNINNIQFIKHMPLGKCIPIINTCDMGIISLDDNIIKYAYPSKMMTYANLSLPIISLISEKCQLNKEIEDNYLGLTMHKKNINQMAIDIAKLSKNSKKLQRMKYNVKRYYNEKYNKPFILKQWATIFNDI